VGVPWEKGEFASVLGDPTKVEPIHFQITTNSSLKEEVSFSCLGCAGERVFTQG
jgi:hypothetical protein